MTKYHFRVAILLCCLFALPEQAEGALRKGHFRLGFDSTFFRFGLSNFNPDDTKDDSMSSVTFGAAMPNTGALIGYSVINGLVVGARISVGIVGNDQYFVEDHYLAWSISPYLEYVFRKEVVRPFLAVQLGVDGLAHYQNDDTWWWGFNFAGGAGIHFFLHQNVSVDLSLLPGFTIGTGEMAVPGQSETITFKHWRFTVAVPIGVSGWF